MFKKRLILIGAGPGDPELITLKAIRALKQADLILYDALVNPALLDYVPAHVPKLFCGKRLGRHWMKQQQINDLIRTSAAGYGTIVRLKGGDPFVFGRAAEEMETARTAGLDVEVIPGISSALSVPATQQIPLTARGMSESFWVITGTTCSGGTCRDLELAAQSTATLVFLMAMHQLETITETLIRYGKADIPAAIIQNGTLPTEKVITGKVKDIALRAAEAGLGNPAVIIVGKVVLLQKQLKTAIKHAVDVSPATFMMENPATLVHAVC